MDRFDDLLIKARAEMLGKSQPRQVITKDTAFSMAWDLTKGFEDQMRAMQARQQRPGFMQRMKNSFTTNRNPPQQSVSNNPQQMGGQQEAQSIPLPPRNQGEFQDPFGQATGNVNATATQRASGSPPTMMADLGPGGFGQEGGAERPLEPNQVPMREDFNTEQPPAPVQTERTRSLPPTMRPEGISPSQRAKITGAPSDQRMYNALNTLNPERQSPAEIMARMGNQREKSRNKPNEQVRPLSSADVPKTKPQEELSERTKGNIGDRKGSDEGWGAYDEYNTAVNRRQQYVDAIAAQVESGQMTEDEAMEVWMDIQERTPEVRVPDLASLEFPKEEPMSLDDATQKLVGGELKPNQKREAVEPTREKTTTREYKRPINQNHLPVPIPKPSNTALSTRGEEKIEPLDEIPMQDGSVRQLGSGPIRNPPQLGEGRSPPPQLTEGDGTQRTSQAKAGRKLERPNTNIIDNFKRPKRKRTPKKKEPEPPQVEEQTERVKQLEPQVEEEATKLPTAKQTTLFGGSEESAPVEDNKATETEATARSERRKRTRGNTEATTKVGGEKGGAKEESTPMKAIRNMSSEEVGELMTSAREGNKKALSHLKNYGDEIERVHPQFLDDMEEFFGPTEKMTHDTNLSLLPSGMRNSLLKDNNADVNYSLLPNGWV